MTSMYILYLQIQGQTSLLLFVPAPFLPPMMIFPYKKKPLFNPLDDFPNAHFEISPNGWITAEVFLAWMRDVFVKQVSNVKKSLCLFVDGHSSHTALLET